MKKCRFGFVLVGMSLLVAGCPFTPPEAVLSGTWSATPEDPGDFEGWDFAATFDSNGQLVGLSAESPDGATADLEIVNATTEVSGSEVTITIPRPTGTRVFDGTLSADQNTITGSLTQEIDLGELEVSLPGGGLTLERQAS